MAASLLATGELRAQNAESEIRIDQYQPASPGSPFGRAEGPLKRFDSGIAYGFRLNMDYAFKPLLSDIDNPSATDPAQQDGERALVEHALLLHLGAALRPIDWLNIELNWPFAIFESGEDDARVRGQGKKAGVEGAGDGRLGAHFQLSTDEDAQISLGGRLWFPSGTPKAYMTSKGKVLRGELVPAIAGEADMVLYGCTLGVSPMFFGGGDGDRLAASCALHFKAAPSITLGIEPHAAVFSYKPETSSSRVPGPGNADYTVQFEPLAAAAFSIGDFRVGLAAGPGIGNAPGTAQARAVLTLSYASLTEPVVIEKPPDDDDVDGIPNEYDACPQQAGPKERRGCPEERDIDGDGIIEGDACPNDPGAEYADPQANGCPDGDNDHIADPVDPCPNEPGPAGAGSEGCPKYARLKGGKFVVNPAIQFERRTGKLTKTSRAALIEVIRTMRANPKLESVSVSVGMKGATQRLTDQHAKEVLELFDDQNFPTNRFEVVLSDELKAGNVSLRIIR